MAERNIVGVLILDAKANLDVVEAGGTRPVGRPRTELDPDEIRNLYVVQCLSLAKVAEAVGVTSLTLRKRLGEYGIPVRGRGRPVKAADRFEGGVCELDENCEVPGFEDGLAELLATEEAEIAKAVAAIEAEKAARVKAERAKAKRAKAKAKRDALKAAEVEGTVELRQNDEVELVEAVA